MAQMKQQNKISGKKKLSETEIADLSDADLKTLVKRLLRELIEDDKGIREEMKATLSEIKKNPQVTKSEGK